MPKRQPSYLKTGLKICKACKALRSLNCFYKSSLNKRKDGSVTQVYSSSCKSCHNSQSIERHRLQRLGVIKHYSNGTMKCSLCDEDRYDCLDIDHIKNDGSTERSCIGDDPKALVRKLIAEDYPEGYQVLCRNCNWIKFLEHRRKV